MTPRLDICGMRFNIYRDRNKSLGLLPSGKHIIYWTHGIHFDNILTVRGLEDLEPPASNTYEFFYPLYFLAYNGRYIYRRLVKDLF